MLNEITAQVLAGDYAPADAPYVERWLGAPVPPDVERRVFVVAGERTLYMHINRTDHVGHITDYHHHSDHDVDLRNLPIYLGLREVVLFTKEPRFCAGDGFQLVQTMYEKKKGFVNSLPSGAVLDGILSHDEMIDFINDMKGQQQQQIMELLGLGEANLHLYRDEGGLNYIVTGGQESIAILYCHATSAAAHEKMIDIFDYYAGLKGSAVASLPTGTPFPYLYTARGYAPYLHVMSLKPLP